MTHPSHDTFPLRATPVASNDHQTVGRFVGVPGIETSFYRLPAEDHSAWYRRASFVLGFLTGLLAGLVLMMVSQS